MSYGSKPLTRYGGWLPDSPQIYKQFFDDLLKQVRAPTWKRPPIPGLPSESAAEEFKKAIEADQEMLDLFEQTFEQV